MLLMVFFNKTAKHIEPVFDDILSKHVLCKMVTFQHNGNAQCCIKYHVFNAWDGIRTHVPFRANGFQDRLVMTTSIPKQVDISAYV